MKVTKRRDHLDRAMAILGAIGIVVVGGYLVFIWEPVLAVLSCFSKKVQQYRDRRDVEVSYELSRTN